MEPQLIEEMFEIIWNNTEVKHAVRNAISETIEEWRVDKPEMWNDIVNYYLESVESAKLDVLGI